MYNCGWSMASPFGKDLDETFMRKALVQAWYAFKRDEVPVGAVVVDSHGVIIGRGYNQVERFHTQAAHAEMIALKKAGAFLGDWRLLGCWLYVTLEPCAMCYYAAVLSRCAGIIFGASSPLFGYQGVDNEGPLQLYKENVIVMQSDICAQESERLLKSFFRVKRTKKRDEL